MRDPPPAAAASTPSQTSGPPASASPSDSNTSAPLPDSLPGNKSKPENCSHNHLSDSSPAPGVNPAWPLKTASPGTQSPPIRSGSADRPAQEPARPQTQPSPLPTAANAQAPAHDRAASRPARPATAEPRAPLRPNFPLHRVLLFRKISLRPDHRSAPGCAGGERKAAERKSIGISRHGKQRPMLRGPPFRLESLSRKPQHLLLRRVVHVNGTPRPIDSDHNHIMERPVRSAGLQAAD